MQMENKHINRCLKSIVIREMQIKTRTDPTNTERIANLRK